MKKKEQEVLTVPTFVLDEQIELMEALKRLKSNSDYKTVFEEYVFKKHVIGLTSFLANAGDRIQNTFGALKAVSELQALLDYIIRAGEDAKKLKENPSEDSSESNVRF